MAFDVVTIQEKQKLQDQIDRLEGTQTDDGIPRSQQIENLLQVDFNLRREEAQKALRSFDVYVNQLQNLGIDIQSSRLETYLEDEDKEKILSYVAESIDSHLDNQHSAAQVSERESEFMRKYNALLAQLES